MFAVPTLRSTSFENEHPPAVAAYCATNSSVAMSQANESASAAQGDRLRDEADDSTVSMGLIADLANRYAMSLQATARRVAEESQGEYALSISFRGSITGRLMPAHLYCSRPFEENFRWQTTGSAANLIDKTAHAARHELAEPLLTIDTRERPRVLEVDALETRHAMFVLYRPTAGKGLYGLEHRQLRARLRSSSRRDYAITARAGPGPLRAIA